MKIDLSNWPRIDVQALREVPLEAYPELECYTRAEVHKGLAGQGGLFLASDMAKMLTLRKGMRVLDLGCGAGATSVFLAKKFQVTVLALDEEGSESLIDVASKAGVAHLVTPIVADARNLPFPPAHFDAVFSMNAFFYFGTDSSYPSYLLEFLKNEGEIVIGSPCYAEELTPESPEEFMLEYPACLSVHSPQWWRVHFEKTGKVDVSHSELHPRGVEFWEDRMRYILERFRVEEMSDSAQKMIFDTLRMLNRDRDGFVSHFMLHAKKNGPNKAPEPTSSSVTPRAGARVAPAAAVAHL